MAQLTDDCFAFGGALMRIEDAVALIGERLPILAGTGRGVSRPQNQPASRSALA